MKLHEAEQKNAELSARLGVREQIHGAVVNDLEQQRQVLEQQLRSLERQLRETEQRNAELEAKEQRYTEILTLLKEELAWFKAQVYGRSSERSSADVSPDQAMLFNEPEVLTAIGAALGAEEEAVITIDAHERRKKPGRKLIPAEFPRQIVEHDLPEGEKVCPHDGTALEPIGFEKAERYHFEAPKLIVKEHRRHKYGCMCCRNTVKIAPLEPHILPKSMAEPSLLAHITTAKFADGLPLTRQAKQFERLGVNLGAGTMGLWINTIGAQRLPPLINLMHEAILAEPVLHCDETPVQVLKSEKPATSDHYMIVRAAGPPGRRIVLFNYEPNRNVAAIKRLLTGPDGPYRGKLIADGLGLYEHLESDPAFALTLCGCWVHARRGFDRALKVSDVPQAHNLARIAMKEFIGQFYAIERSIDKRREARERSDGVWNLDETRALRQQHSAPITRAFKAWLDAHALATPPKSALGKAIGYCLNQWEKLIRFLEHPEVPLDNNRVENDIRPFAVGRKAWLFCDTQLGAQASANLYSLVGTCRANGIEPLRYLTHLYEQLPRAATAAALEALLPWNVKPLLKAAAAKT